MLTISLQGLLHFPAENMPSGPVISDWICKSLVFFLAIAMQARLTTKLTPGFSKNLEERLPDHNRVLFSWWLNPSDQQLKAFMLGVSAFLSVVLWVPSLRGIGLPMGVVLSITGLYSDLQLKESFIPHTALLLMCCAALYLE